MEPFYFAGGTLAAWALLVTAIGVRRENFPGTPAATRVVAAISIVLVAATIGLAIYLSATEEHEKGGEKHTQVGAEAPPGTGAALVPWG